MLAKPCRKLGSLGISIIVCLLLILMTLPLALKADTFVAGRVSGHWYMEDSPFIVENTIWVESNDTLFIHSDVDVLFIEEDSLIVFGTLITYYEPNGNRIRFAQVDGSTKNWYGIFFDGYSSSGSVLRYSKILDARSGILISNSNPRIEHNYIAPLNYGIKVDLGGPHIIGDTIVVDTSFANPEIAFGIHLQYCYEPVYIRDCFIDIFVGNNSLAISAFGIRAVNSNVIISNNKIHIGAKNKALGIYLESSYKDTVDHNEVKVFSISAYIPGALSQYFCANSLIINNTFLVESPYKDFVLACEDCESILVMNNIIFGDGLSIGIISDYPSAVQAYYNDLFNHSAYAQNVNLDNSNIFTDPLFLYLEPDSVYQLDEHSLCIDRGNPNQIYNDPDLTRNDIGAYYHHQPPNLLEDDPELPVSFELFNVYPNPTNNSGVIRFIIDKTSNVRLDLYDISGRLVESPYNENLSPGYHSWNLDLSGMASGIYFIRLITEEKILTEKVVLMK